MAELSMERMVKNLDRRVTRVEQILPTLATKKDLDDLRLATKKDLDDLRLANKKDLDDLRLATKKDLEDLRLATREELRAAIAPLATKEELRAGLAQCATKRDLEENWHKTQALFESTRDDIKKVAEGVAHLTTVVQAMDRRFSGVVENHEVRLLALEAERRERRGRK